MSIEGYPDDFETQNHSQSEWDDYERAKQKLGKQDSGKPIDYKTYKRNLSIRNLSHNFKKNTEGIGKALNALAPFAERMESNIIVKSSTKTQAHTKRESSSELQNLRDQKAELQKEIKGLEKEGKELDKGLKVAGSMQR